MENDNNAIESQVVIPKAVEELPGWAKSLITDLRNENAERRVSQKELKSENQRLMAERAELAKYKAQYDDLKLSSSENEKKITEYSTKVETLEKTLREDLIQKIPAKLRDKYASMEIELLRIVAEDLSNNTPNNSAGAERGATDGIPTTLSELTSLNNDMQAAFKKSHPEEYNKMIKQMIGI